MLSSSSSSTEGFLPAVSSQDVFLVGLLMQANSSESGWKIFLDAFCSHFNLHSVHLYIANPEQMSPVFQECAGVQPSAIELKAYMEEYFQHDLAHIAILNSEPHSWIASNLMPNREEVEKAKAYIWAHRNNIHYVAGGTIFRDNQNNCVIVHNRSKAQGEYQELEIERFCALSPYIEHAMRLRLNLSKAKEGQVYIRAALNKMRVPVAVLNEFGELLAQNNLMQGFIESQASLTLSQGTHLKLENKNFNRSLQLAITQSVSSTKNIDLTYSTNLVPIHTETGSTKAFIGVDSIIEGEAGNTTFRGAMVYILAPELIGHLSEQALKSMFSLTDAEAKVCHYFSKLKSAKDIAREEHKSVYTVREQLRTIFAKTGVANQMQLINLLASVPAAAESEAT
ncbi:helix-turn-helix transcriptional regulator [Gilvimarinus sp. DA14]|uniref:helix-turn-helix transcriptional regulator n=1 Tax=Gilvimarinus sp. DA14 TaxID=2956798 RepID=UPI0020B67DA4|nr:helix-turn-helix transcriptional regulator [Gilvimarinus sp. DA14]UTF59384.1 helix-turn-helix transcriptional regulator [Gilvimarinus sp. DA14]